MMNNLTIVCAIGIACYLIVCQTIEYRSSVKQQRDLKQHYKELRS